MHESGEGRGSTDVRVKHIVEAAGNHVIRFCCALWVYNCTGLPIALQQVTLDEMPQCMQGSAAQVMHRGPDITMYQLYALEPSRTVGEYRAGGGQRRPPCVP